MNWKFWTFGIFLWLCTAMHMKKCITIHVLLGNIRPRFRYSKMQILWSFQGGEPPGPLPGLYHGSAGGLVAPPSTQTYRSLHVVPTTWHASQTKRQKKYDWGGGGGAINRAASPAASLPPCHCISAWYFKMNTPIYMRNHFVDRDPVISAE